MRSCLPLLLCGALAASAADPAQKHHSGPHSTPLSEGKATFPPAGPRFANAAAEPDTDEPDAKPNTGGEQAVRPSGAPTQGGDGKVVAYRVAAELPDDAPAAKATVVNLEPAADKDAAGPVKFAVQEIRREAKARGITIGGDPKATRVV
ncbi:MAG: hypothetical protein ACRC7O_02080, partial [Fimbriiglobus sp.]